MISTFISLSKPTKKPRRQSHRTGNSRLQGKSQGASSELPILQAEDDADIKGKKMEIFQNTKEFEVFVDVTKNSRP